MPAPIPKTGTGIVPGSIWKFAKLGGAGFIEAKVGPEYRKGFGSNGPWRNMWWFCEDWDDSDELIDILRGGALGSSGSTINFPTPSQFPGNTNLFCVNAEGTPQGPPRPDAAKVYAARGCWIYAEYQTRIGGDSFGGGFDPYGNQFAAALDDSVVPYVSYRATRGLEQESTARDEMHFEDVDTGVTVDVVPTGGSVPVAIGMANFEFRRGMIPSDLCSGFTAAIQGLVGSLNSATFGGCTRGTLTIDSFDFDYKWDAAGNISWEYGVPLRWRQYDHNAYLVDGTLDYFAFLVGTDGEKAKPYKDFSILKTYGIS